MLGEENDRFGASLFKIMNAFNVEVECNTHLYKSKSGCSSKNKIILRKLDCC